MSRPHVHRLAKLEAAREAEAVRLIDSMSDAELEAYIGEAGCRWIDQYLATQPLDDQSFQRAWDEWVDGHGAQWLEEKRREI